MGPEPSEISSGNLVEAPSLTSKTDKFKYRNAVRMWMQRVKVFATGGDGRAKGISNGFGHALYAAMDHTYQKIIDSELALGRLSLGSEDEDEIQPFKEQKELVEKILLIVAKDSTTDAAKRFINSGRRIFSCKRGKSESHTDFYERFRGVAQENLNCFEHAPTEQEKQHIALILLDNADLPDSIYNNLLSILINKSSKSTSIKLTTIVNHSEVSQIMNHLDRISNYLLSNRSSTEESASDPADKSIENEVSITKDIVSKVLGRMHKQNPHEHRRLNFSLEDTFDALMNIRSAEDNMKSKTPPPKPVSDDGPPNMITNLMSKKFIKLDKRSYRGDNHIDIFKRKSRCAACGMKVHWARDKECQLYGSYPKGRQGVKRKDMYNREMHPKKSVRFHKGDEDPDPDGYNENSHGMFFSN